MTEDELLAVVEDVEALDSATEDFAASIADSVESFLIALRAASREDNGGRVISLLLLEISQVLLAGARLGAQVDFEPRSEYQPDVGPDADLDDMRLRLAKLFGGVDTYSLVFDPYDPEVVDSSLSDDLTSIAADLENGLRHYRSGDVDEALWWWQFSYVSSWGNLAGALLNALLSVVAHDRLDVDVDLDADQVARRMRCWPRDRSTDGSLDSGACSAQRRAESHIHRRHEDRYPWALSCRSTAARRWPMRPASSGSPSASSRRSAPVTTSSSWSPPWATRPTSCVTSPSR